MFVNEPYQPAEYKRRQLSYRLEKNSEIRRQREKVRVTIGIGSRLLVVLQSNVPAA